MRLALGLILLLGLLPTPAWAALNPPYYNSTETKCSQSDANILLCENLESGAWYVDSQSGTPWGSSTCASSGNPNPADTGNKGWCGNFGSVGPPVFPTATSGKGIFGFTYAARSDGKGPSDFGATNTADHALLNFTTVTEWYLRFYYWADTGYTWTGQKMWTFNNRNVGDGGIDLGNTHCNCGNGGASTDCNYQLQLEQEISCAGQNISSISIVPGKLYYIESHHILSTGTSHNGTYELWINDCGTNRAAPTCTVALGASPTLRAQRTDLRYGQSGGVGNPLGVLYGDFWSKGGASGNEGSSGTNYWSNLIVSKAAIGFMEDPGGSGGSSSVGTRVLFVKHHMWAAWPLLLGSLLALALRARVS